jgi:hypothetical protein
MPRSHKKTRKMRGGGWMPWTWSLFSSPTTAPAKVAQVAAPVVDQTVGTPSEQAAALGMKNASPSAPVGFGGRRKTRKHRKSRRKH